MVEFAYGNADFGSIRRAGAFYVDKTPFLPILESLNYGGKNLVFSRPRRFGKSSLISMMFHYYDIASADQYDELFRGLWVYEHPTPEKNKFLVLHFNFSTVAPSSDEAVLQANFLSSVQRSLIAFASRYRERHPTLWRFVDERMETFTDPGALMEVLLGVVQGLKDKVYVLIDEYDTFAIALLSTEHLELYQKVTDKMGFVRAFYRALKAGGDAGAIARVFMTGGTPILLDDLMSGFNVALNISTGHRYNALAGFTKADVARGLDELLRDQPELASIPEVGDREQLLTILEAFYDGYRFSPNAKERIFNSTMVIYFLRELAASGEYPRQMLDANARTDYQKLHSLWIATGPGVEERRAVLEQMLTQGQITSPLIDRFGVRTTTTSAQFVSLMYYTGMLTLAAEPPRGPFYMFEPPNRVIRELGWEHYTRLLEDIHGMPLTGQAIGLSLLDMVVQGSLESFLDQLRQNVLPVLSVRDLRKHDEKAMKMLLMGLVITTGLLHVLSEKEFAQGFNDLFMCPVKAVATGKYAWMIELKYLTARAATPTQRQATFAEAEEQLQRYASDKHLVPMLTRGLSLKAGTLLFVGGKEVVWREWTPPGEGVPQTTARGDALIGGPSRRVGGKKRRVETSKRSPRVVTENRRRK